MKVAIVGTSHILTENEERDIQQTLGYILNDLEKVTDDIEIISGGAKGVDTMAIELAHSHKLNTCIIHPNSNDWMGYKQRNLKIAEMCDILYCITTPRRKHEKMCYHHIPPQDHTKTGGCWTMKEALKLEKNCKLMVTPKR